MKNTCYASFGFFCIVTNALVNLALTYSGVGLLNDLLFITGVTLPPASIMIGVCALSGLFAGMASFLLGMDFWIRNRSLNVEVILSEKNETSAPPSSQANLAPPLFTAGMHFFKSHENIPSVDLSQD